MCSTGAAHGCTRPGTEWVYDRRLIVDGKVRKEQKMKGREKKIEVVVENFGISFFSLRVASCDRDYTDENGSERGWIVWVWCGVGMRGMVLWWIWWIWWVWWVWLHPSTEPN